MDSIDLTLDNNNELTFQISIEGSSPAESSCRFLIEGEDMSFVFPGEIEKDGIVHVNIPPLEKILKEGTYNSGLEVIVDDRVFVPLTLRTNFEKSVTVTAEAVSRKRKIRHSASAQLIGTSVKKRAQTINVLDGKGLISEIKNSTQSASRDRPEVEKQSHQKSYTSSRQNEVNIKEMSENQIRNLIRNMIEK
jgi:hypothetical protein